MYGVGGGELVGIVVNDLRRALRGGDFMQTLIDDNLVL